MNTKAGRQMESELRLTVSLLGPFQVSIGGQPLDTFRTSKVQALLVYLLVESIDHPALGVARDGAMTLLWPEMPEKSARDNLRQTLYLLRQAIPEVAGEDGEPVPFVLSDNQRIRVNPAAIYDLDVATFTSLLRDGGRTQLERAVALYQGDFLADFYLPDSNAFEAWAGQKRAALRREASGALERLAADYLEEGQPDEALAYARRQLKIDELRESASRQLMEALARGGRRNEALAHYERWRERLWEELSVEPTAETQALASALRSEKRPETGREKGSAEKLPGGPVTFLFTDIEGSTQLWERDAQAMQHALLKHDKLLQAAIEEQGGEVIKTTGDGFYAVFRHPLQGVQAAVEAQRALARERWDSSLGPLAVRMGLLTGPAEPRQGDYHGKSVNRAARLCDAAHGGQILISASTQALIAHDLSDDLSLLDLGSHRLRGLTRPEHIYQLCAPELETDFPPLRTPGRRRQALPEPQTSLLGREKELADVQELLTNGTHLVTITGPGGIGKTRLAVEVAHDVNASFEDGAAFISLTPLSDAEALVPAVAQALGFDFRGGGSREPLEQLLDYLRSKELLLVLDNFEHLLEAVPLLTEFLQAAPEVRLLTTSRERLKLQAEQVYPLHGLGLSRWESLVEAQDDAAVQLFLRHAQRVRPSFTLRPEHLEPLQEILRLVGGMPLAVILAAGWVEVLSPAEIVAEIDRNLDFLEATSRHVPARQQSMGAVFEGTWARLSEEEQRLYAALSIFRGGFTLKAARDVAGASLRDLVRLVGRSLLTRVEGGRFEQHELLRQFAAQELAQTPQEERAMRGRHSAFYCRYLGEREADLKGARALETEAEIEVEYENVRAAWRWAADHGQEALLRQAAQGLGLYHWRRRLLREGAARFRQAQEKVAKDEGFSVRTRAMLLSWQSILLSTTQDSASKRLAEQLARQAVAQLDEADEAGLDVREERALALLGLGSFLYEKPQESLQSLEASLALYDELGMRWEMAGVHGVLAGSYMIQADYHQVHENYFQAQRLYEMVGDEPLSNVVKLNLGVISLWSGQLEQAEETEEAIREVLANDPWPNMAAYARMRLGEVLLLSGQFQEAQSELVANRAEAYTWARNMSETYSRWATLHLGRYRQAWQEGRSWPAASQEARTQYNDGFNNLVLGCAALALRRIDAARGHLQESVTAFRAISQHDEGAWARAGLGYVTLHEGDAATARNHLKDALRTASAYHLFWPALHALPAAALFMAELGDEERAADLYALASRYEFVANSQWFEDVAGRRINAVAETLPEEAVAAARARGQARDLWETAAELLEDLSAQN